MEQKTGTARRYLADSRAMPKITEDRIALVRTSPPYWHLKDYGVPGQVGYGQSLHEYMIDLSRVWKECYRVLLPGRRLCINIGEVMGSSTIGGAETPGFSPGEERHLTSFRKNVLVYEYTANDPASAKSNP